MGRWYLKEESIYNFNKKQGEKSMSVNKVILLGRLGQDPELKTMATGTSVCNFSIATSETWKDKNTGQKKEKTDWSNIVVWGKTAELCNQYLSKGRQAFIEGKLQTRQWEDKEGNKRYTTEIKADTVQFIGGQSDSNQALAKADNMKASGDYEVKTDSNFASDSIPF